MVEIPGGPVEKARYGFRLCLGRPPRPDEQKQLVGLFEAARADYAAKPDQAQQMTNSSHPPPEGLEIAALAAWTTVANVLLNLDETLMKP